MLNRFLYCFYVYQGKDSLLLLYSSHMELTIHNEKLQELLQNVYCGVVSSCGDTGVASAAVYFALDKDLTVYFHTRVQSTKYKNMEANPEVSFAVFSEKLSVTLQMQGTASIVTDVSHLGDIHQTLVKRITKNEQAPPLLDLDQSIMVLMKITPTWVRFGDFSHDKELSSVYETVVGE
jgi:general stress protein 26